MAMLIGVSIGAIVDAAGALNGVAIPAGGSGGVTIAVGVCAVRIGAAEAGVTDDEFTGGVIEAIGAIGVIAGCNVFTSMVPGLVGAGSIGVVASTAVADCTVDLSSAGAVTTGLPPLLKLGRTYCHQYHAAAASSTITRPTIAARIFGFANSLGPPLSLIL